ncbi:MAG: glycosyltransferase [Caldimicrobium sp.]|nr:glycosyltransferase [Caldimicrobium sp.]MDW8182796.1 glycosyltransferase [Caldimicrobium sp.]
MKIIDITPFFHSKSGGIRRYLLEKTKFLADLPHIKHTIIIPGEKGRIYKVNQSVVYEVSSFPVPFSGGYRYFRNFRDIEEILMEEKPDIVEFGGIYHLLDRFRTNGYRKVAFYHSDVKLYLSLLPLPWYLRNAILREYFIPRLNKADLILSPSHCHSAILRSFGLERVKTLNLGLDTALFSPEKRDPFFCEKFGLSKDIVKLLYVGRLSPEKNIDLLLRIIEALDPKRFHLFIAGEGQERFKVEKCQNRLPNLTYLGYIDNQEELASLYASCDIFLSISRKETFGLSFLEAQASGCLLVSLDMGLETQPFKDFLVKSYDLREFKKLIEKAAQSLSESIRHSVSSYIRSHFSWEITFKRLLDYYRYIL